MTALFSKMLIFVVLMLIGYFGARTGALNAEFTKAASKLTINVFMVATIINSVISNTPQISGEELWKAELICFALLITMYLLAIGVSKLVRVENDRRAQFMLMLTVVNNMFVGLPVVQQLYGNTAVFYMALTNIPYNIILYTYGVWKLSGAGKADFSLKKIFSLPLIGTLAAVTIFITHIHVPQIFCDLCSILSGATMPLSMMVVGASLGRISLLNVFKERSIYLAILSKLVIAPLLVAALMNILGVGGVLAGTMIIFAACPTGIIVTILSIQYGRDAEYTSSGILVTTAVSMVTIPLMVYFLL